MSNPESTAAPRMSAEEMVFEAIRKVAQQQATTDGRKFEAFEGLLLEISTGLADVVEAMEKGSGEQIANALSAALKAVRIEAPHVTVDAPVTVNVSPTPIHNHVTTEPPVVHLIDRPVPPKGWSIAFKYDLKGGLAGASLTRIA